MAQQQQQKAHVPKFGNWDNDGNVPYTLYFENARKGKGGKMINPNDPAYYPEAFSVAAPSPNRTEAGSSPAPPPMQSPNHRHAGGERPRRGSGGGHSVEQSPVHPYSLTGKAGDHSEGGGYGLVANSVERPRGNETPTRGSAVPKFGDWESNPDSADGYTHIFNGVREGKQQNQAGKPAAHGRDAARGNGNDGKQRDDGYVSSSKFSCFGWCK